MVGFSDFVQTRTCWINEVSLIGYQGRSMDEEKLLFNRLNDQANEILAKKHNNPYLVVSGKYPTPLVAVEVTQTVKVPEGMTAFTIPEGEYVAFKCKKEHVGHFWANVCTNENQEKYDIDLSKPRFEIFSSDLQSTGFVEWYIPTLPRT